MDDVAEIVSLMNSIIVRDRMCAYDLAKQLDRELVAYKDVPLQRLKSLISRIRVEGSHHRAAKHGVFDREELESITHASYDCIVHEFSTNERTSARLISLRLLQAPAYEHVSDAYIYSFILDFDEGT